MYQRDVLPNGIRVATETVTHVESVSLGIWIAAGSRHETDAQAGTSHFIEHVLFKGTDRRSARDIAEVLDSVGGRLNAFTDKENTCYYAKVLKEHLPLALDVLSDLLLHPRLDPEELEREKNVVLEEIKRQEDAPEDMVHDLFAQALWPDHPLGRPVIGLPDVVSGLDGAAVREFMGRWYTPDAIVVAASGNVTHEAVTALVEQCLGGLAGTAPPSPSQPLSPAATREFQARATEQVHLVVGSPGIEQDSQDRYALAVLDTAYGGGMSSRLFQNIREERGLAYSIGSYFSSHREGGLFAVYAGTSRETCDEVLGLIDQEQRQVVAEGITGEELQRAKNQIRGALLMGLESTSFRMSRLAKSELYFGRIIPVEEVLADLEAVTLNDVKKVTEQVLDPAANTVLALGPFDGEG